MKKFKKRFLKFSCIISTVMVLTFTVISPFSASAGQYYPDLSIPLYCNMKNSGISILTSSTANPSDTNNVRYYESFDINEYFMEPGGRVYGSYWRNSEGYKLNWFFGRMIYVHSRIYAVPSTVSDRMSSNCNYRYNYSLELNVKNYLSDGNVEVNVWVMAYNFANDDYDSYDIVEFASIDDPKYYDSSTGLFTVEGFTEAIFNTDFVPIGMGFEISWNSWTSSSAGGGVFFSTDKNILVPYYDNSADVPNYPNYNDGSLNDYNDKVGEADSFVEGNLDNVSNMFSDGLTYLTGSFRNTMLYVGSILTTLTNAKFLSVLIPISLSIGFIAFLLVGASFISKSAKSSKSSNSKKGGS